MTGGHKWKEMMFDVPEHMKCNLILEAVSQRPGDVMRPVAVMVHRPHGKKCSQTLADDHGSHVVPQQAAAPNSEYGTHPCGVHRQLGDYGCAKLHAAVPERCEMQQDGKYRAEQKR